MSKDAGLVQDPALGRVLAVHPAGMAVSVLPEHTALDALIQGRLTLLHVTFKDLVQGDLGTATLDDVTTDLQ